MLNKQFLSSAWIKADAISGHDGKQSLKTQWKGGATWCIQTFHPGVTADYSPSRCRQRSTSLRVTRVMALVYVFIIEYNGEIDKNKMGAWRTITSIYGASLVQGFHY